MPRSQNRLGISIVDLTFAIWALVVPTILAHRLLNSDGDLARHLSLGRSMLRDGLVTVDDFSHTRAGSPFLAYEWLSQMLFGWLERVGGLAAITLYAAAVIGATYAVVVLFMRRRRVDALLAYLTGILAAILGSVHWLARPHLITGLAVALLLLLLESRGRRSVLLAAPLFVLWANLHPGFVIGLALIGAYMAGEVIEAWTSDARAVHVARARRHLLTFGIAAAATLLTPHGYHLPVHVISHLNNPFLMGVTNEFISPNFHSLHGKIFLLVLLAMVVGLAIGRKRPSWPHLLVIAMMTAGALISRRNIPLFGIVALPLLAIALNPAWRRWRVPVLSHVRRVFQEGERIAKPGRAAAVLAALMLVLGAADGRVGGAQLVRDRFDARTFPVEAVASARAAGLDGTIFNEFTWGGFILYSWPEQRIFIDGLTDYFGADLTRTYMDIAMLQPGWDRKLDEHRVSLVIVPPKSALAYALRSRPEWQPWYEDATAVILRRDTAAGTLSLSAGGE